MRKLIYLTVILTIGLAGCNPKIDFSKFVPDNVNNFATGFISEIQKGNIDSCLTLVLPELNDAKERQLLSNTFYNIQTISIDTFSIINASMNKVLGEDGYTNYMIDYEYKVEDKYLYFSIGIREQNHELKITSFDGRLMEDSLLKAYAFNLNDKGFLHYLFLFFAILIPIFIIVTLIFAIKTRLNKKWLWIIGILLGFIKFSINWTTGQVGFSLINFSILGAGFLKSGIIAPWILSFSIPIVAIIFWFKRSSIKKEENSINQINETIENQ